MRKLLFTLLILITCNVYLHAQVVFHDIIPDTTVNTWSGFTVAPATSPLTDIVVWWHPWMEVVIVTDGDCELLFNAANMLPAKLDSGAVINAASGTWLPGNYDILDSGSTGNWQTNATDKYIGFRFKNTTTWYYGWLKMTVAPGAVSFTVKEWAYNASGDKIKAGQISTTGINTIGRTGSLSLYPNPANNCIRVKIPADDGVEFSIADINAKTVSTVVINKGQNDPSIDISALPAGTYYISAKKGVDLYTAMFVKH